MEQHVAKQRLAGGGYVLLLGVPDGAEVGLDLLAWQAGPKFKGWKMVPPGPHLLHSAAAPGAPRASSWVVAQRGGVAVFVYNPATECFAAAEAEDADAGRHAAAARRLELDAFLGPYPFEHYDAWCQLTSHVTPLVVAELQRGPRGVVSAAPPVAVPAPAPAPAAAPASEVAQTDASSLSSSPPPLALRFAGLPAFLDGYAKAADGGSREAGGAAPPPPASQLAPPAALDAAETGHPLAFTVLPGVGRGSRLSDRTTYAMDTSDALAVLAARWGAAAGTHGQHEQQQTPPHSPGTPPLPPWAVGMLGELQAAFVCFLAGQSYDGLEQWKRVADTLCRAEAAVEGLAGAAARAPAAGGPSLAALGPPPALAAALSAAFAALAAQIRALPADLLGDDASSSSSSSSSKVQVISTSNSNSDIKEQHDGFEVELDTPGAGGGSIFVQPALTRLAEILVSGVEAGTGSSSSSQEQQQLMRSVAEAGTHLFDACAARLGWAPPAAPRLCESLQRREQPASSAVGGQGGTGGGESSGFATMEELLAALAAEGGDGDLPAIVLEE